MKFSIENLGTDPNGTFGTALEVTIKGIVFRGELDEWLFERALFASGVQTWRKEDVSILAFKENDPDALLYQMVQVLLRFDCPIVEVEKFVNPRIIPARLHEARSPHSTTMEDEGDSWQIRTTKFRLFDHFDERMF